MHSKTTAGIKLIRHTLEFRHTDPVIGNPEGWEGELEFEVSLSCTLEEHIQHQVAEAMAVEQLPSGFEVSEWALLRCGNFISLSPKAWEEIQ